MESGNLNINVLAASDGCWLTQAEDTESRVFTKSVYLAKGDSADNYIEVTDADKQKFEEDGTCDFTPTTADRARIKKIAAIKAVDESNNTFTVSGFPMWIDKDTRTSLIGNTIPALESAGTETIKLWSEGTPPTSFTVTVAVLKVMLEQLELYAKSAYDVTQSHIAAVYAMTTAEEINAFDETAGYPEKLTFTL